MYIQSMFDFPLPNNGDRYDLSQEELVTLLQKAYDNGWNYARQAYDKSYVKTEVYPSKEDWDRPLTMSNDEWKSDWR